MVFPGQLSDENDPVMTILKAPAGPWTIYEFIPKGCSMAAEGGQAPGLRATTEGDSNF